MKYEKIDRRAAEAEINRKARSAQYLQAAKQRAGKVRRSTPTDFWHPDVGVPFKACLVGFPGPETAGTEAPKKLGVTDYRLTLQVRDPLDDNDGRKFTLQHSVWPDRKGASGKGDGKADWGAIQIRKFIRACTGEDEESELKWSDRIKDILFTDPPVMLACTLALGTNKDGTAKDPGTARSYDFFLGSVERISPEDQEDSLPGQDPGETDEDPSCTFTFAEDSVDNAAGTALNALAVKAGMDTDDVKATESWIEICETIAHMMDMDPVEYDDVESFIEDAKAVKD